MTIEDRLYGTHEITELVLVELMQSAAVQRLKGISQSGLAEFQFERVDYSRFEHCVGVMLLLRLHGASLEEQVAGLLHDVSHTAFSHMIDFVIGDTRQENFQDLNHESYIRRTDIPQILKRHGMTVAQVVDYHQYSLLEQDAPRLCADRLDYAMREMPADHAAKSAAGLTTHNGIFCFSEIDSALVFARAYVALQKNFWGGYDVATRYDVLSRVLKRALELHLIAMDDFWKDDATVLARLRDSGDDFIHRGLAFLSIRDLTDVPKMSQPKLKKFRFIDPDVLVGGRTGRLTELSQEYAEELIHAREDNAKGVLAGKFE